MNVVPQRPVPTQNATVWSLIVVILVVVIAVVIVVSQRDAAEWWQAIELLDADGRAAELLAERRLEECLRRVVVVRIFVVAVTGGRVHADAKLDQRRERGDRAEALERGVVDIAAEQ